MFHINNIKGKGVQPTEFRCIYEQAGIAPPWPSNELERMKTMIYDEWYERGTRGKANKQKIKTI